MAYTATSTSDLSGLVLDVYSEEILHNALGVMRFMDFAVIRQDLMREPGDTIKFTKYADITGSPALTENTAMTENTLSSSSISVTVSEFGSAVAVSEKLLQLAADDVLTEAAMLLGRHFSQWGPDRHLMTSAFSGTNVKYANGRANRGAVLSTDTFDTALLREAVELLQTGNAPKFDNEFYICHIHPHQARYLRQDPDWVAAQNYNQTRRLFNGEIGMWEDIIFVQSTNMPHGAATATEVAFLDTNANDVNDLSAAATGGIDLYAGILFGDHYLAFAEALPVEMRDNGVQDFGRKHSLAWYSIYGSGRLNESHGVRLETA